MKPMTVIHFVDAFARGPFTGNPAAVCVLEAPADAAFMQKVAFEMNLSETAFVHAREDGFALRWFTPEVEVPLCGHATLASAHTLWELDRADGEIRFHTASGVLTCKRQGDQIALDFPSVAVAASDPPRGLIEAMGVKPVSVWATKNDYLIELADDQAVRAAQPDFRALRRDDVRCVTITARASDPAFDIVSRVFAPGSGIDEDPATGSAHCLLTPFWSARLHKRELRAFQASRRGGYLEVALEGDRVELRGQALTTLRGALALATA
jgi:PhzF family phenazine biosynthesis protein